MLTFKKLTLLLFTALLCITAGSVYADNQQLAFPGADGYGKYVTGGRGGEVCYVTRLDDCTDANLVPGTLRWAIRHDNGGRPRTILFAKSGTIYLTSKLRFQYPDISILGQSAPGGGVCVAGYNMYISKDNVIVRYIRFRAGDVPSTSMTGLDIENAKNVIIDHCSMTWSMEECLTAYDTDNTTVQWCIIGEGLYSSKNAKGSRAYAMQWGGEHSTMHHTLITNSHSRSPRFNGVRSRSSIKGEHDYQVDSEFANNVVFNWSSTGAIYGGEYDASKVEQTGTWTDNDKGYDRVYMINNYYRPGPSTKVGGTQTYFASPSTPYGEWYLSGNKFEVSGTYSPWTSAKATAANENNSTAINGLPSAKLLSEIPYALSGLEYEDAEAAFSSVTTKAGASLPRYDVVDRRLLDEAAGKVAPRYVGESLKSHGDFGIIDSPSDITLTESEQFIAKRDGNNGYETVTYPFLGMKAGDQYMIDSDADGMPDAYEDEAGLNKKDASDGSAIAANGYTNLENYLNGLADGDLIKSDYETSDAYIAPGKSETTETFNVTYTLAGAEGTAPAAVTGKSIQIGQNTTVYKEGYTMIGWQGTDGRTYIIGETYPLCEDVTLSPLFRKNTSNIAGHQTTLNLTWIFDPCMLAENSGIIVTSNYVDGEYIDTKLAYDNGKITLPWGKSAYFRLNLGDNITSAEEGASCTFDLTSQLAGLDSDGRIDLVIPVIKSTLGNVTVLWRSSAEAVQAPAGYLVATTSVGSNLATGTKTKGTTNYWSFTPASKKTSPDASSMVEFTVTPVEGIKFTPKSFSLNTLRFGTDGGKWNVAYVTPEGKEVTVGSALVANRDNNAAGHSVWSYTISDIPASDKPFKVRVYIYDNSGKTYGINNLSIKGSFEGEAAVDIPCVFNLVQPQATEGTVTVSPAGNIFPAGTKLTINVKESNSHLFVGYKDEMAVTHADPAPVQVITIDHNMTYQPLFINSDTEVESLAAAPYDAVCENAMDMLLALKYAKNHAGQYDRMRILLKNGEYDLASRAMTEVPANVSLIGESQEGVMIKNNIGAVTDYQTQTPVLFIDQNQNNVYMQDLTIRQARDWNSKKSTGQALALRQRGKLAAYKNVTLQGVQDTYYINKADATAYFESSNIAGEVDFIYGDGTVWFEKCNLQPVSSSAIITASNAQTGYKGLIFNDCVIDGDPSASASVAGYYLGRPWNDSPAVTYLNTTMKAKPADAGWTAMKSGLVCRFHEYGSKDANGNLLDLSKRSIAACGAAQGSDQPVLTESQAAAYTLTSTFPSWNPKNLTAQVVAPQPYFDSAKKIVSWEGSSDAIGYAVYCDGKIVGVTTGCSYEVSEGEVINIRAINAMGGLGEMSAKALPGDFTGVQSVINGKNINSTKTYSISGQMVSSEYKGIVIANGKKFIKK